MKRHISVKVPNEPVITPHHSANQQVNTASYKAKREPIMLKEQIGKLKEEERLLVFTMTVKFLYISAFLLNDSREQRMNHNNMTQ